MNWTEQDVHRMANNIHHKIKTRKYMTVIMHLQAELMRQLGIPRSPISERILSNAKRTDTYCDVLPEYGLLSSTVSLQGIWEVPGSQSRTGCMTGTTSDAERTLRTRPLYALCLPKCILLSPW